VVAADGDVAELVGVARRAGLPAPEVGLAGGDLWRTLGGSPGGGVARLAGPEAVRVPLDAVRAVLDGAEHWFAAHLVARSRGWSGRFVVAMNAEWLGEWKVAPRAHPGDGLLDVIDGSLGVRQRLVARRRARSGDHVPHPGLQLRRVRSLSVTFERSRRLWLDGRFVGRCRSIELTVEPDAFVAYV
jgi:diacylglycerol kinase family enzyme